MKLLKLELKNFRQHKSTILTLKDGVTGILGQNGSGKSSLVEAISFSLYGSKSIRGTLDELKSRDEPEGVLNVALTFEIDSTVYRVERSLSDAKFFVGGKLEVKGSRDVTSKIEHVIGMNYDEFVSTFYTEQKGLEFLSRKKGGAERERFIMRLLGYDKVEKVQEKLRDQKRNLKSVISSLEFVDSSEEELKSELEKEEELLETLNKQEKELSVKLIEVTKEQEEEKKALERISSGREEYLKLDKERKRLEGVLDEQKRTLSGSKIENLRPSKEIIEELNQLSKLLEVGDKVLMDLVRKVSTDKAELQLKKSEKDSKRKALSERKKSILSISKIEERCPTCGQSFENIADAILHLEHEEKVIDEIVIDHSIFKEAEALHKQKKKELDSIRLKEANLKVELQSAQESERLKDIQEKAEHRIKETKDFIVEIEGKLKKITYSEEKYLSQRTRLEVVTSILTNLRMERLKVEGDIKESLGKINKIKEILKRLVEQVQIRKSGREEMALLESGDTVLSEFRSYLASSIKPRLCELTSEFLYELTDARYREAIFSEDFTPQIVDDGEILTVMSGGEEDILHLSVRLALSQLLAERAGREFSLLILDEVFGSLDELRRSNLLVLLSGLTNRFEQIFVISHFEDVKDAVDNVIQIQVDERTGGAVVSAPDVMSVVNI